MIDEFRTAMAAAGCASDTLIVADDRIHRFHHIDDKRGQMNGRYQLAVEGGFGFGWFKWYKEGVTHKWHSKSANMTATEQAALKAKIEERRKVAEKARREEAAAARQRAESIWAKAAPCSDHPYLSRKGVPGYGLRSYKGTLIVPAIIPDKGISTLQFISATGEKKFLTHSEKKGAFFTIPGSGGRAVCEGYATGATIHRATGWEVRVCFDSGNLKGLAEEGDVICADNDLWVFRSGKRPADLEDLPAGDDPRWTEWRQAGLLWNPGIEAAEAALKRLGGKARVVSPKVENAASRPTDFNDLEHLQGLDAVRDQLTRIPEIHEDGPPSYHDDAPYSPPEDMTGMVPTYEPDDIATPIMQGPFKIMGHNNGTYYYLPSGSKQLVALSPSSHSKNNLLELAPLSWWEERFRGRTKAIDWDFAINALIQTSQQQGIFKPEAMLRGSGVWIDEARVVVHCGDRLIVDGKEVDPFLMPSRYVYQASTKIFDLAPEPLESLDAQKLLKICQAPSWENPLSGTLLAGWIVIAPLSAALDWRPHIWITGESQAGKSFVLNKIIMRLLDWVAIRVAGGTSEPGIRQLIGYDGRPVVLDEAETESQRDDQSMQQILMLARRSSSGDQIAKGSQDGVGTVYAIKSAFCFSSINPAVKQRADESRISMLSLRRNRSKNAEQEYVDLKTFAKETLTDEFAQKMLTRTVQNIKTIIKNAEAFTDAAASALKDRRAADQIGPMLAGVYSLFTDQVVTVEKAEEWIRKNDWTLHTAVAESADHDRLYDRLMTATIPVLAAVKNARHEAQLGTVIQVALGYEDADYSQADARAALRNVDVKVTNEVVYIRRPSQHIPRLLRDTPWVNNWVKSITNVEGVTLNEPKKLVRFGATTSNAVLIPAAKFKPEGQLL